MNCHRRQKYEKKCNDGAAAAYMSAEKDQRNGMDSNSVL
jgi:hypothetical protein